MLVDFHRMLLTHDVALSVYHFFHPRKNPYKYVHSVKIELAKLILVGTRITCCRMAEVYEKGTQGSVLAWSAASFLLGRLLFLY